SLRSTRSHVAACGSGSVRLAVSRVTGSFAGDAERLLWDPPQYCFTHAWYLGASAGDARLVVVALAGAVCARRAGAGAVDGGVRDGACARGAVLCALCATRTAVLIQISPAIATKPYFTWSLPSSRRSSRPSLAGRAFQPTHRRPRPCLRRPSSSRSLAAAVVSAPDRSGPDPSGHAGPQPRP